MAGAALNEQARPREKGREFSVPESYEAEKSLVDGRDWGEMGERCSEQAEQEKGKQIVSYNDTAVLKIE